MNGAEGNLPVEPSAGTSWERERHWGLIGGLVGALVGVGGLVVAWLVQGEAWGDLTGSPPAVLEKQELQVIDFYFLAVLVVGAAFLVRALITLRVGRYPRSDGFGATLIGLILCALGGTILFVRLVAVLDG
jgi:magnesium-transporting ATPase (P-type)